MFLQGFIFQLGERVNLSPNGWQGVRFQINGMVPGAIWRESFCLRFQEHFEVSSIFQWDSFQFLNWDVVSGEFPCWFGEDFDYLPCYDGGPWYVMCVRGEASFLSVPCLEDYR